MALDKDELKKRRQQREQQRQQRLARQRRQLKLGLLAAAAILALCGILIFAVSRKSSQPGESAETGVSTQAAQPSTQATTPTQTEPAPTEPTTVIHFAAAGDLNVTDKTVAAGGPGYDYSQVFLDVAHLLSGADLTAINFEGNFFGEPYGSDTMSAPQNLASALSDIGVDIVQAANSRSIYNGMQGLAATLQGIRAAGMEPLGAYASREEFRESGGYLIRNVNGIKVALVAFTKGMDSMGLPAGSEDCVNLLYTDYASTYQSIDTEGITAILQAVAQAAPDITIALLHWGSEYNDQISSTQTKICNLMQENGVDAIIGTHPHYVQQMVFDAEAGTFVAYSLGDFFGDAELPGTEYSVILDLEITKDNATGVTKITNYSYTPIFTLTEDDGTMRVLRIREAMAAFEANFVDKISQEAYDDMAYALQRIEARTTPDKK